MMKASIRNIVLGGVLAGLTAMIPVAQAPAGAAVDVHRQAPGVDLPPQLAADVRAAIEDVLAGRAQPAVPIDVTLEAGGAVVRVGSLSRRIAIVGWDYPAVRTVALHVLDLLQPGPEVPEDRRRRRVRCRMRPRRRGGGGGPRLRASLRAATELDGPLERCTSRVAGSRGAQGADPWIVSGTLGATWTRRLAADRPGGRLGPRDRAPPGQRTPCSRPVNYDATPLRLVLAAQNSVVMAGVRGGVAVYRVTTQQTYTEVTPLVGPFLAAEFPIAGRFRGLLVGGFDYFGRRTELSTGGFDTAYSTSAAGAVRRRGRRGGLGAVRIRGRLAPSRAVIPHREPETDDAALIAAARLGDGAAFARLFRRHADAVRTRITRLVGPVAERDDLVQKVFIAFHRALPAYRSEAKLSTYLHRIAVNTAYDHLRGRHRAAESEDPLDAEALVEQLGPALEDQVAARADLARLLALLDQLSPKKRIAFVLVAVEGCSLAEAAALIGAPEDTVKQRALYARRDLLARLAATEARDGAAGGGNVVIRRRDPEAGAAESEELERLCDRARARRGAVRRDHAVARRGAPERRARARARAAPPARAGAERPRWWRWVPPRAARWSRAPS